MVDSLIRIIFYILLTLIYITIINFAFFKKIQLKQIIRNFCFNFNIKNFIFKYRIFIC